MTSNTLTTTYPLLTSWLNNDLSAAWIAERDALRREDPKLPEWDAGHKAAARLSLYLSMEQERMESDARRRAIQHRSNPDYTDELIEFYDALQSDDLDNYRGILQDISGNRSLMADEIRYAESISYSYEVKLEWEIRRGVRNAN